MPFVQLLTAVATDHPNVAMLLEMVLVTRCPYIVPYVDVRRAGEAADAYRKRLGYQDADGDLETQERYVERMAGHVTLFSAAMVRTTAPERGPLLALQRGWIWMARVLNRPVTAAYGHMLRAFLQVAGNDMRAVYGDHFGQLLQLIRSNYVPLLRAAGANAEAERLVILLDRAQRTGTFAAA